MKFSTYAVVLVGDVKHRHYIGSYDTLTEAKHVANCATCGNADYAYIKELGGNTVFFIRPPDYESQPLLHPTRPTPRKKKNPIGL